MAFRPGAPPTAAARARTAGAEASAAWTDAVCARRNVNVPTPQNRSATRTAPRTASVTTAAIAASACGEAWRNAPGGRTTVAGPSRTIGERA